MAVASSTAAPVRKGSPGAAAALAGIAVVALLYLFFVYQLYNDPGLRQLGFNEPSDIAKYSFLVFALLFVVLMLVRVRWAPSSSAAAAGQPSGAAASSAVSVPGGAVIPSAGHARPRVSAEDPASRPGAPPSTSVPNVPPEELKGGWKRYRFPAERTGGLYVDSDIVVDSGVVFSDSGEARRGRFILRVRDEVARVCVRCDLIEHCHGRVGGLISLEEMRGNHDCIPGLKRIANVKMAGIKAAKEAAAAKAAPAPVQDAAPAEAAPVAPPAEPSEPAAAPLGTSDSS